MKKRSIASRALWLRTSHELGTVEAERLLGPYQQHVDLIHRQRMPTIEPPNDHDDPRDLDYGIEERRDA